MTLALALALVPSALTLADDGNDPPRARTEDPTQLGSAGVTLQGRVDPMDHDTTYWFDYGLTTDYGSSTPVESAGNGSGWVSVARAIEGLAPSTTYHFRVEATDEHGTTYGADKTFTTSADRAPAAGGDDHSGPGSTGSGDTGSSGRGSEGANGQAPAEPPKLGQTVGVTPTDGVVRIRKPHDDEYGAVEPGGTVPTGTVVDTRRGKVALTTALPDGRVQTGTFWGGVFEVRQSRHGNGSTELRLRGRKPRGCPRRKHKATASAAKRRRGASLWGHDHGGRFRTRGHNSVASVRGTTWLTSERCSGTLTFVREGVVVVRAKGGRTVTVRAGHAFLARPRR